MKDKRNHHGTVDKLLIGTNAVKLVFSATACCKVVFRSVKKWEAIDFHSDPYY